MMNATIASGTNAKARQAANETARVLARYEEWSNATVLGDANDAVSTYAVLARMERTVRASEIDLGLGAL